MDQPVNPQSLLPGVNVLVEGPTGVGKTHILGTLADTGLETFVLFTESGMESFLGYWTDKGKPVPANVHWHVLARPPGSLDALTLGAETVGASVQDALYKMADYNRAKTNLWVPMLKSLKDFPDDRTGQKFGSVDTWGPDRALCIDSLTGINDMAFSLVIGNKPIKSQTDWGLAQDHILRFLKTMTDGAKCHFILTAHVERETDMVFGGVKITVSAPGKALAPKIPPMFSDVILAQRLGTKFSWSTGSALADLKARNLPIADDIVPGFGQIIEKWKSRGGAFSPTVKT